MSHLEHKLEAYLDGALDPRASQAVEAHLNICPACQAELDELRQLSHLLRAAPLPEFTPVRDFKSQVLLQLPRQQAAPQRHAASPMQLLPWLAPAAVVLGWIFAQVTLNLAALVSLAGQAGWLGHLAGWTASAPEQSLGMFAAQAALSGLLGAQGRSGLELLGSADLLVLELLSVLLIQAAAAALYWAALAFVWRGQAQNLDNVR